MGLALYWYKDRYKVVAANGGGNLKT